jgi:hypothetical protein
LTVPETVANVVLTCAIPVVTRGGAGVVNVASAPALVPPEFLATSR